MMSRTSLILTALLVAIGCNDAGQKAKPTVTVPKPRAELLQPRVWDDKPRTLTSVAEARDMPDGTEVNLVGVIPNQKCKPFNSAVAAVIVMDPTDLANKDVKDELNCSDAAVCPKCRKLINNLGIQVELADEKGNVVPSTLESFSGMKAGTRVAFSGKVQKGKQARPVRFIATSFAIQSQSEG